MYSTWVLSADVRSNLLTFQNNFKIQIFIGFSMKREYKQCFYWFSSSWDSPWFGGKLCQISVLHTKTPVLKVLSMYFILLYFSCYSRGSRSVSRTDSESGMDAMVLLGKCLTGGNWQKWKRVFLTCPCHEIYRDEAVGLKSCKNTWKITIFVKMWNLGAISWKFDILSITA